MQTGWAIDELELSTFRRLVTVAGDLDLDSGAQLGQMLRGAADDGALQLIVDVSQVAFADSSGLGVLLAALRRARAHDGDLVLVGPGPGLEATMRATATEQLFACYATVQLAARALDEQLAGRPA